MVFELEVTVNKVKNFMLDLPGEIENYLWPNLALSAWRLMDEFNSSYYDPQTERAIIYFLVQWNSKKKKKKLASIYSDILTDNYVKVTFESTIPVTLTFHKADLNSFKFSLSELKEFLAEKKKKKKKKLRAD